MARLSNTEIDGIAIKYLELKEKSDKDKNYTKEFEDYKNFDYDTHSFFPIPQNEVDINPLLE